jgi:hypothetical protein
LCRTVYLESVVDSPSADDWDVSSTTAPCGLFITVESVAPTDGELPTSIEYWVEVDQRRDESAAEVNCCPAWSHTSDSAFAGARPVTTICDLLVFWPIRFFALALALISLAELQTLKHHSHWGQLHKLLKSPCLLYLEGDAA